MSISGLRQRDISLQSTIYPFLKQDNYIYVEHPFLRKTLSKVKTCQMCFKKLLQDERVLYLMYLKSSLEFFFERPNNVNRF